MLICTEVAIPTGPSAMSHDSVLHILILLSYCIRGTRGGIVVKALRYKPARRGFDSR
jgi:hypothetical protein